MFWTGFACGVVVTVALGVAAWHILSLYDPSQAASDPLRSPDAGLAYRRRWRRSERSGSPVDTELVFRQDGGATQPDSITADGAVMSHIWDKSDNGHE